MAYGNRQGKLRWRDARPGKCRQEPGAGFRFKKAGSRSNGMVDLVHAKEFPPDVFFNGNELDGLRKYCLAVFLQPPDFAEWRHCVDRGTGCVVEQWAVVRFQQPLRHVGASRVGPEQERGKGPSFGADTHQTVHGTAKRYRGLSLTGEKEHLYEAGVKRLPDRIRILLTITNSGMRSGIKTLRPRYDSAGIVNDYGLGTPGANINADDVVHTNFKVGLKIELMVLSD
jgi:hypothetical protein